MIHLHMSTSHDLHEQYGKSMHQLLNKQHKKKTLHILTRGTMQGCDLTSLVVCINGKTCDVRERNVTIRSEI